MMIFFCVYSGKGIDSVLFVKRYSSNYIVLYVICEFETIEEFFAYDLLKEGHFFQGLFYSNHFA
jgi:hypothetical protein